MLTIAALVGLTAFLPTPPPLHATSSAVTPLRQSLLRCCAVEEMPFEAKLSGLLADAESSGSMDAAIDKWLERLDESFIPDLGVRIETAKDTDAPELPQLTAAMTVLQERTQVRFERARDQLQTLLGAGEIRKLDSRIVQLVKSNEIDAGFFYVLFKNLDDATAKGDEESARLIAHVHTRVQEELEKQAEPALALLHKLTRMDDPNIRANLLRHNLVPQTSAPLPGGGTLPLKSAVPALVEPMDLASAIEGALDKMISMSLDPAALQETVEDIRNVAKEARVVVEEAYDDAKLQSFTEALTPSFARAMAASAPVVAPQLTNQPVEGGDS